MLLMTYLINLML